MLVQTLLRKLGIDRRNLRSLPVLPLVEVAWADGEVQEAERELILRLAEDRYHLEEEGRRMLRNWLHHKPSQAYVHRGQEVLLSLCKRLPEGEAFVGREGLADVIVLNLPMIGLWVKLLNVPYRILFPIILVLCCVGTYSTGNATTLVIMLALFAILGYVFVKLGCETAPFLLGFVLGPLMEENLRRSMVISFGDPTIFLQRPISLGILVVTVGLVALIVLPTFRKTREVAF